MKIILDNIIFFMQRSGGMSVYWSEVISRLLGYEKLDINFLEPLGQSDNIFYPTIRSKIVHKISRENLRAKVLSFLPYKNADSEKYIFHSSYYRTARSKHAINVVTIHDFIPEYFFHGFRKYFHTLRKREAIRNATGILCISNSTKRDLLKFYPYIQEKSIKVVYNGVSKDYFPIADPGVLDIDQVQKKFILFVGKRPPYKNFGFAIQVIESMKTYHFVIAGDSLSAIEKKKLLRITNNYTLIENPTNTELNKLYNCAHCLLYPSSYEGFGIPVVEAMRAGCPVVALNAGSIPEVADGAALLSNVLKIEEFSDQIHRLENPTERKSVVIRGIENAKRFDWDNSASEIMTFYEELYSKTSNLTAM